MKRLIIISTVLFAAASAFGIAYFVQYAHDPLIQNLYTPASTAIEEVPIDVPEYYINHQGDIDSLKPPKKYVEPTYAAHKKLQSPKTITKKKNKQHEKVNYKSFSRAAIPEYAEPIPTNNQEAVTENSK